MQSGLARRNRFYFLKNILFRCQQVTGLLDGTMSHGVAYDFVRAGRNLERADMTTRIVDSAVFLLMPRKDEPGEYDNILWVSVLKSLSGFQMYRQHVRNRVVGDEVVRYLLKDSQFPRSVLHSVDVAEMSLNNLPRNEAALRSVARLRRRLNDAQTEKMSLEDLHEFIDELQGGLNTTHESISNTWFSLEQPGQQQAQSG